MNRTFWKCETLSTDYGAVEKREMTSEEDANLVSSLVARGMHAPVIDLDVPHKLVPSSTPGHSHLYIDVPMPWRKYRRLLRALYRSGVIEKGFYLNSIDRRMSFVRKPGVTK